MAFFIFAVASPLHLRAARENFSLRRFLHVCYDESGFAGSRSGKVFEKY
jgi:hypothetical protein